MRRQRFKLFGEQHRGGIITPRLYKIGLARLEPRTTGLNRT